MSRQIPEISELVHAFEMIRERGIANPSVIDGVTLPWWFVSGERIVNYKFNADGTWANFTYKKPTANGFGPEQVIISAQIKNEFHTGQIVPHASAADDFNAHKKRMIDVYKADPNDVKPRDSADVKLTIRKYPEIKKGETPSDDSKVSSTARLFELLSEFHTTECDNRIEAGKSLSNAIKSAAVNASSSLDDVVDKIYENLPSHVRSKIPKKLLTEKNYCFCEKLPAPKTPASYKSNILTVQSTKVTTPYRSVDERSDNAIVNPFTQIKIKLGDDPSKTTEICDFTKTKVSGGRVIPMHAKYPHTNADGTQVDEFINARNAHKYFTIGSEIKIGVICISVANTNFGINFTSFFKKCVISPAVYGGKITMDSLFDTPEMKAQLAAKSQDNDPEDSACQEVNLDDLG